MQRTSSRTLQTISTTSIWTTERPVGYHPPVQGIQCEAKCHGSGEACEPTGSSSLEVTVFGSVVTATRRRSRWRSGRTDSDNSSRIRWTGRRFSFPVRGTRCSAGNPDRTLLTRSLLFDRTHLTPRGRNNYIVDSAVRCSMYTVERSFPISVQRGLNGAFRPLLVNFRSVNECEQVARSASREGAPHSRLDHSRDDCQVTPGLLPAWYINARRPLLVETCTKNNHSVPVFPRGIIPRTRPQIGRYRFAERLPRRLR